MSITCGNCGGVVAMHPAAGDTYTCYFERRLIKCEIPEGTMIPKCGTCNDTYFGPDDTERVIAALIRRLEGGK